MNNQNQKLQVYLSLLRHQIQDLISLTFLEVFWTLQPMDSSCIQPMFQGQNSPNHKSSLVSLFTNALPLGGKRLKLERIGSQTSFRSCKNSSENKTESPNRIGPKIFHTFTRYPNIYNRSE